MGLHSRYVRAGHRYVRAGHRGRIFGFTGRRELLVCMRLLFYHSLNLNIIKPDSNSLKT